MESRSAASNMFYNCSRKRNRAFFKIVLILSARLRHQVTSSVMVEVFIMMPLMMSLMTSVMAGKFKYGVKEF